MRIFYYLISFTKFTNHGLLAVLIHFLFIEISLLNPDLNSLSITKAIKINHTNTLYSHLFHTSKNKPKPIINALYERTWLKIHRINQFLVLKKSLFDNTK